MDLGPATHDAVRTGDLVMFFLDLHHLIPVYAFELGNCLKPNVVRCSYCSSVSGILARSGFLRFSVLSASTPTIFTSFRGSWLASSLRRFHVLFSRSRGFC